MPLWCHWSGIRCTRQPVPMRAAAHHFRARAGATKENSLVTQERSTRIEASSMSKSDAAADNTEHDVENQNEQVVIDVEEEAVLRRIGGPGHANFRWMAETLGIQIGARGEQVHLVGPRDPVSLAKNLLRQLIPVVRKTKSLQPSDIRNALQVLERAPERRLEDILLDVVVEARGGRAVYPKGLGQKFYVDVIRQNDICFAIGPAGTGKTYLAMSMAVQAWKAEKVARIILTRPAVEAGERLGFLPGDLEAKVNPYLRPLYDAMFDLLGADTTQELLERRVVEVAPLAFMRGRTLNDAFIVLDEAQNTTPEQMKMFLTRLGFGSKAVVTGDVTQVDLPKGQQSGLGHAMRILEQVEGVGTVKLTDRDVVRHPLVQRVVRAYDQAYEEREARRGEPATRTARTEKTEGGGPADAHEAGGEGLVP